MPESVSDIQNGHIFNNSTFEKRHHKDKDEDENFYV